MASPVSESRRRWPERSSGCRRWRGPKRSARWWRSTWTTRSTRSRPPGLPWRRWRRRICARHRGTEARHGRPQGAREQRTSDEFFDLHSAHLSLRRRSLPLGAQLRHAHRNGRDSRKSG
ncbi:hypothetical protein ABW17_21180 [Mycobacterium nebraskense]|nr:hypothetical protein WU83_08175 [Mycobacterium nebraskense]KLO37856.1 hypothetical protein ABW17_21180 [Mycobacterium nebraskense]